MAMPFATEMLEKHGEFFPYGAETTEAGESRMVAADPGHGERPPSGEVLAALVEGFRRSREQLRTVALVSDVRLESSDAVRVELEHRQGQAIVVLLPYRKKRLGRGIEYGPYTGTPGVAQVWNPT